jgi:hypothetical protein
MTSTSTTLLPETRSLRQSRRAMPCAASYLANDPGGRIIGKRLGYSNRCGSERAQPPRRPGARGILRVRLPPALDLKDDSHYGTLMIGSPELRRLIRAAETLVAAAEAVA